MARTSPFAEVRLDAFRTWCSSITVPGITRTTFNGIVAYLLSEQQPEGNWEGGDNTWNVVMTSVVLKSLAAMQFHRGDAWEFRYRGREVSGGVDPAVEYVVKELTNKSTDKVGEDIWDTCQALLAMAAFGRKDVALSHVRRIASEWESFYDKASKLEVRWRGPAYLAAMVDVLVCYRRDLDEEIDLKAVAASLAACEATSGGQPCGAFRALRNDANIDRWNSSLVLRTLCSLPDVDVSLVERCAGWLLDQLKQREWDSNRQEAPMFIARCLEGLYRARPLVTPAARAKIEAGIEAGNRRLTSYWSEEPSLRVGIVKSYAAVSEYLAALTVPAATGLIFDMPAAPPAGAAPSGTARQEEPEKIFIVHGRDMPAVNELQLYIQNDLQLGTPIVLWEQPSGGETVIEKFEREAESAGLVFVLITPDDLGHFAGDADPPAPRGRQNVFFELGYFMAKLGRKSKRLILLSKGPVELPSDITGIIQIDVSNGAESAGKQIRGELGPRLEELRRQRR